MDVNGSRADYLNARQTARKFGGYVPVTRGSALGYDGSEPFEVLGFIGADSPGPRIVNRKAKVAARAHRKRVKRQQRHMKVK